MQKLIEPGRVGDQQIILTPEARRGDFLDYHISVKLQSMSRMDPQIKQRNMMEFLVKGIPAVVQASLMASQVGVALSVPMLLQKVAIDMYGLDWFDEVFSDPAFQQQMWAMVAASPGMQNSKGTTGGVMQNGQPGTVAKVRSGSQQKNRDFQMPAAVPQSEMDNNQRY